MLPHDEVQRINGLLVPGFEKKLFEATLAQAEREDDPLRANNFSYALRELSRHILKRLAPDEEVESSPWFIQDPNYEGITRFQRIKFAIQGHLEDGFLKNTLEIDYKEEAKELKKTIDALSKYTHVEEHTFAASDEEVRKLTSGALNALAEMFRSMFDCRERTLNALSVSVDESVVSHVVQEALEEFHDYATHHAIDEVIVEQIDFIGFEGDEIYGSVSGTVSVTLQYGSAGDRRRGDGFETDASANFSCNVTVMASDLEDITIDSDSFKLDNEELSRSWRGEEADDF